MLRQAQTQPEAAKGSNDDGKTKLTRAEMLTKVKYTIGWYNKFGNLKKPIIYKTIKPTIQAMSPGEALKILGQLDEKQTQINNPTRWIKKAAESSGFLDPKVKRTIWWYNDHGDLPEPIRYDEVKKLLGRLAVWRATKILSTLAPGKGEPIRNPTSWICKAAQKQLESGADNEKSRSSSQGSRKGSGKGWRSGWRSGWRPARRSRWRSW